MSEKAMLDQRERVQKKRHKKCGRQIAGQAVLWVSIAAIAILAIPAGMLIFAITGIWNLTDRMVGRKGRQR